MGFRRQRHLCIGDSLFTIPLAVLLLAASLARKRLFAIVALAWVISYPLIGLIQRERAIEGGYAAAATRNHYPPALVAKPSFGNLIVWKTVYEIDDHYYVDAIRAGLDIDFFPGESVPKLELKRDFPWLATGSQQARDIDRFRWFSNGFIAKDPENGNRIIDIRYSMIPNEISALWGIELSKDAHLERHALYETSRERPRAKANHLLQMIFND